MIRVLIKQSIMNTLECVAARLLKGESEQMIHVGIIGAFLAAHTTAFDIDLTSENSEQVTATFFVRVS